MTARAESRWVWWGSSVPNGLRYSRVIPTVDVASKLLGDVLGEMRARLA